MEPQRLDEFLKWKPNYPEAIVGGGVLYARTKMIIYGRYKTLKSMTLLHLARCIAAGQPWMSFKTPEQGNKVIYLQLEIPHPLLHKRMTKMEMAWDATDRKELLERVRKNIYIWTEPFLKLDRPEGIGTIKQYVEKIEPAVIMIDPIYKTISGNILDPNHVREVCDQVDIMLSEFEVSVVFAHHARKSAISEENAFDLGSDDMLGAAVFSYWADTVCKITKVAERSNEVGLTLNFDIIRHAEDLIEPKEVVFNREDLTFHEGERLVVVK
jgi:hypothetical protein